MSKDVGQAGAPRKHSTAGFIANNIVPVESPDASPTRHGGEEIGERKQAMKSGMVPLAGIEPALLAELDFERAKARYSEHRRLQV
ncbi:hypothetical protein [Afipia felis]